MAVYTPLFVYLTPASIPQVVANIQKYLADNPIVSDPEAIAEVIQQYIADHPEIIAVASVNGKTGNVVLTGSDININASSAVSIETQLLNLASMISSAGSDITQIESQLTTIYTNIDTIETNVSNNTSAISALQTSVTGQGTRLAAAETDIDNLESAQAAQGTRLNTAEGNISSLQTRMTQAESDINTNETNIETINTTLSTHNNKINELETFNDLQELDISSNGLGLTCSDNEIAINYSNTKLYRTGNVFYLNLVFVNNKSLPSSGHVTVDFTFNNSYFNMVGGFGSGFSGINSHFGYVQNNTISARVVSTGTCTVRFVFLADNI